ncbi:NUDIX domain-containing protein [Bradyrhizobium sp. CB3481]|uniref:NUDIX domain-containing protein n=1 Tax=Bradyrhizobium sp. CB3481 TaxID=3039158 RepID=UPI0024B2375B|nr:NUDIX domain-containing protein [Bradyrhizobium sp. CB3481]WFU18931.1 NUDIX domain-containing protein [Bradyrhizobium sp. CB3481]
MRRDGIRESAAAILLDEDGRLLMQLRDNVPDIREPGKIGLFGGQREGDESFLDCIVREIQEELGYYLPPSRFELLARWSGPDDAAPEGTIHAELFLARGVPVEKLTIAEGALKIVAVDELEQVRPFLSLPTRYALDTFLPRITATSRPSHE